MKVLSKLKTKGNEIVAKLSDEDIKNIQLLNKLKILEEKLEDAGFEVESSGLFKIIEIEDIALYEANRLLRGEDPIAKDLASYVSQFEIEVSEYVKKHKKQPQKEERRDLAYYQWDLKEETDALRESGYYD